MFSSSTSRNDPRRFTGPDGAYSYHDILTGSTPGPTPQPPKSSMNIRPLFLKTGLLSNAQGSAYVEQGQTKLLCSVFGPREIPRRSDFSLKGVLSVEFRSAPFAHPRHRISSAFEAQPTEKELSLVLEGALQAAVCLHLYPKSQIDVYVRVLEDDGSVLAAAITAAGLALANASIQMFDLVLGASLCRKNDLILVDPTLNEELGASEGCDLDSEGHASLLTIGYQPSLDQLVAYQHEGIITVDQIDQDVELLMKKCKGFLPNVQCCLLESLKIQTKSHRQHE
ncbi:hypothetical protein TCAL_13629 [Tigriopus californicus]|uniref:Exoribonuclease phosphorolytic domain-containing protein n=1 Tax=Tigriopus californicus TaxID=6832 RepID=A0A553P424_TIGCA|nr:exosome complex component MTR3-like [Tigriopus californicus]TRY72445.1 hypothetical protein TCAL_13629 [Tigriopus californicus]